ncbi:MAG: hypothetical protein AVDCRST_MAG47-182 [uncultured Nocardioidaceae bacterium]|uniref:Uncharacterized protein n=1 Tax=uncultured Nocardioidaceae bacterium TaxID=253824 RepID=A0A6J4MPP1_9ACTN|nr:MAG: hypothetical protein AVDCRST_MAG47-182 [uncultured Nocardioidaceae bacterium]
MTPDHGPGRLRTLAMSSMSWTGDLRPPDRVAHSLDDPRTD